MYAAIKYVQIASLLRLVRLPANTRSGDFRRFENLFKKRITEIGNSQHSDVTL